MRCEADDRFAHVPVSHSYLIARSGHGGRHGINIIVGIMYYVNNIQKEDLLYCIG